MKKLTKSDIGRLLSAGNNSKAGKARWAGKTKEEKAAHTQMMRDVAAKKWAKEHGYGEKKLQDC